MNILLDHELIKRMCDDACQLRDLCCVLRKRLLWTLRYEAEQSLRKKIAEETGTPELFVKIYRCRACRQHITLESVAVCQCEDHVGYDCGDNTYCKECVSEGKVYEEKELEKERIYTKFCEYCTRWLDASKFPTCSKCSMRYDRCETCVPNDALCEFCFPDQEKFSWYKLLFLQ